MKRFFIALCLMIALPVSAATKVLVTTNLGSFTIELNEQKAPISSANFLKYVKDGSYVGTIFHRVIPGFMAQGGGFDENMKQRPSYAAIINEATNGLKMTPQLLLWRVLQIQIQRLANFISTMQTMIS